MSQADVNLVPDWKAMAALVATETDRDKVLILANELIRALDKETKRALEQVTPENKRKGA